MLGRFELAPAEAIYVGDSPGDIAAARAVGVPIIAAAWYGTADRDALERLRPDHLFDSVAAFGAFLRGRVRGG